MTKRARVLAALATGAMLVATSCLSVGTVSEDAGWSWVTDVNNDGLLVGRDGAAGSQLDTTTGVSTPLGTLGGTSTYPEAINDGGTVVGGSQAAGGVYFAFVKPSGGPMSNLGTLAPVATSPTSWAYDINSDGVVVGSSNVESGTQDATRAFVHDPATGTMTDIGTLGGTNAKALAINDAGVIVGWSEVTVGSRTQHPFVYDPATGVMHDVGSLGGTLAQANDLNENGTVVGWGETTNCPFYCERKAFSYELSTGVRTELVEGLRTDLYYEARGINEDGVVVGVALDIVACSRCQLGTKAVAWELGTTGLYDLSAQPPSTEAFAINDSGLAVGTISRQVSPATAAFWVPVT